MRFAKVSCAAFALLATAFLVKADTAGKASIGSPVPQFSLQDQNGKTVNLSDFGGKTVVLEWVNPNCPFVQRHYEAKTMINLANEYSSKNVVWLAINSTNTADNAANKSWVEKNSLTYPILNDSKGEVGKEFGAKSTPDMFVIDQTGKLVYEGAIDNDPSGDKSTDKINYVNQALSEIGANKPVSTPQTQSYGCSVKYAD